MTDLKSKLLPLLAKTTSQAPVDTDTLAQGHRRRDVEAALMGMYQARIVGCCKLIKGGNESVLWWLVGHTEKTPTYLLAKNAKARRAAAEVEV